MAAHRDSDSDASSVIDNGDSLEAFEAARIATQSAIGSGANLWDAMGGAADWTTVHADAAPAAFLALLEDRTATALKTAPMLQRATRPSGPRSRSRHHAIVTPAVLHHLVCRATQLDNSGGDRVGLLIRNAVLHHLHVAAEREDPLSWFPDIVGPRATAASTAIVADMVHRLALAALDPRTCTTARQLAVFLSEANAVMYNSLVTYEFIEESTDAPIPTPPPAFVQWQDTFLGRVLKRLDGRSGLLVNELWQLTQALFVEQHTSFGLSDNPLPVGGGATAAAEPPHTRGSSGAGTDSSKAGEPDTPPSESDQTTTTAINSVMAGTSSGLDGTVVVHKEADAQQFNLSRHEATMSTVKSEAEMHLSATDRNLGNQGESTSVVFPGEPEHVVDPAARQYAVEGEWPLQPAVSFIARHITSFLHEVVRLMRSPNFLARRLALRLVMRIITTPQRWRPVAAEVLHSPAILASVLLCLEDTSPHVRPDAYHALKVFIAFPPKCAPVRLVFQANRDALAKYLSKFKLDEDFDAERTRLLQCLGSVAPLTNLEAECIARLMRMSERRTDGAEAEAGS
jgi:hypothetical protein